MIRNFQFQNNFQFQDDLQEDYKGYVKADYSSFGYYDGMVTEAVLEDDSDEAREMLGKRSKGESETEIVDCFNIVGIREEDDSKFWNSENTTEPLVFVTFIRLKNPQGERLNDIMKQIEESFQAVCYTTFDSSDLIVCIKRKKFSEGYHNIEEYGEIIEKYDSENQIQKGFSILSVRQDILNKLSKNNGTISDEIISCNLRCIIKDRSNLKTFLEELNSNLQLDSNTGEKKPEIVSYGIMGSYDEMIYLNNVSSLKLFSLYKENGFLTHSGELYKKTFYNVETEMLVRRTNG